MSPHIVLCLTRSKSWKDTKIARILHERRKWFFTLSGKCDLETVPQIAVKFDDVS